MEGLNLGLGSHLVDSGCTFEETYSVKPELPSETRLPGAQAPKASLREPSNPMQSIRSSNQTHRTGGKPTIFQSCRSRGGGTHQNYKVCRINPNRRSRLTDLRRRIRGCRARPDPNTQGIESGRIEHKASTKLHGYLLQSP